MSFTRQAKCVLDRTRELSAELSHNYIGTDHLAVALLSVPDTEAQIILGILGVDPKTVCEEVRETCLPEPSSECEHRSAVPRLKNLLEIARKRARQRDRGPIGTEDLLGALLESHGRPADILCKGILAASREKAYPLLCASEILKQIGDIYRDHEDYPNSKA